jgi:hypothetical protein
MASLNKAKFKVYWRGLDDPKPEEIEVQYNPTELSFDKSVQVAEINIPGLDSPLLQFVRGQNERLSLELFFDTTDQQNEGTGPKSVVEETDKIYSLLKIVPERRAPPVCEFVWGSEKGMGIPGSALLPPLASQQRTTFKCIVESVKPKFTLFSPEGVPLRATLTVSLRELRTLEEQVNALNLQAGDGAKRHLVAADESYQTLAQKYYGDKSKWRELAKANDDPDPRRLEPGTVLTIPQK